MTKPIAPSHYDVLGLPRDATPEQIKAAYREKRGALHPDREGGDTEAMAALNAAYTVLSDPPARAAYDLSLPDVERDAMEHLTNQLRAALDDENDPIAAAVTAVTTRLQEASAIRSGQHRALRRLRKHLKRMKFKGTGKNVAAALAEQQVEKVEEDIVRFEHIGNVLRRVLELLEDYGYELPEQPASSGTMVVRMHNDLGGQSGGMFGGMPLFGFGR